MSSPAPSSSASPPLYCASPERVAAAKSAALHACASLLSLARESEGDGWTVLERSKDGVVIKCLQAGVNDDESHTAVFLGQGEVDAPLEVCLELIMDTTKKNQFDSVFEKAILIEEFTDSIKVERHVYWAPPLIAKRDLCLLLHKCRLADAEGTVVLTGKSTLHDKCPEDPKYLRADVKQGGWILRRVSDAPSSRTLLTFVASSDLKGSLPPIIRRGLAQKQPGQVGLVKPVLKARLKEIDKMEQTTKEKTMLALQARIANLPTYTAEQLAGALAKPISAVQ